MTAMRLELQARDNAKLLAAPVHIVDHVGDKHARCGTEVRGRRPYCWAAHVATLHPKAWCPTCKPYDPDRERLCTSCRQLAVLGERMICDDCARDAA